MDPLQRVPGIDEANTTRRNATVTALYVFAGLAVADVVIPRSDDDEAVQPEPTGLHAISQRTDWLEADASFTENSEEITDAFEAQRFTTFIYEHGGTDRFALELVDIETDETETILLDESGSVSGAVGIGLPFGQYALDVDADGEWRVELGEPAAPAAGRTEPPATITGEGTEVFGKVMIHDRATVYGHHEGDSAFVVNAWDEANVDGTPDETVFDEIGDFEGETDIEHPGLFYITVEADGRYQLEIE